MSRHDLPAASSRSPLTEFRDEWWGRDDLTDEQPGRATVKKKTSEWCKGKPGRLHDPVLVFQPWGWKPGPCGWSRRWNRNDRAWEPAWACHHKKVCSSCGKILQRVLAARDCPDYELAS